MTLVKENMKKTPVHFFLIILPFLALAGCNLQRNMLYYPSTHLPTQASLAAKSIQFWPSGPKDYRGFLGVPSGTPKGTFVIFHGNAGTAAERAYYTRTLTRLGYRVLLAEYPGYGARNGEPGEDVLVSDAKEILFLAFEQFGPPIVLLGESLGCGVAAAAVKDLSVRIDGIILITPWDTLQSVAGEKFSWLPVRFFLRDTYDTIGNLRKYRGRIAIVGAERDEVIPIRHALALFESLAANKRMYTIKDAGHNDWPGMVDQSWWKEIIYYLEGND